MTKPQLTNRFNLECSVILAVPFGALVMLASLLLEHDDLWRAAMIHDSCFCHGAFTQRLTSTSLAAFGKRQHFKLHRCADLVFQRRYADSRVLFHLKLFAASSNYCKRHFDSSPSQRAPRAIAKSSIIKLRRSASQSRRSRRVVPI